MKTITSQFVKCIFVLLLSSSLSSCEKFNEIIKPDPENPILTLTGAIENGYLTATTDETVPFSWIAEMGTSPLQSFSIQLNDVYFEGWENNIIPVIYDEKYIDSVFIIMPETEGSYTYTLTVSDSIGLTAEKFITATVEKPPLTSTFVYYKNSTFQFVIKGETGAPISVMNWLVTDFNSSTGVASISKTLEPESTQTPNPQTFYLRNAESGALEYSPDASTWVNLTDPHGDINFLFASKASAPSGLGGLVFNNIETAIVSYPEGASPGFKISSEYDASSYDRYFYSNSSKEYYCEATGFTGSYRFISDFQYFPVWTFKKDIELISYKINLPDGSLREGGTKIPDAPSELSAYYGFTNEIDWVSMVYRNYYYVYLSWTDNSDNETHFDIYLKTDDGEFYPLSEVPLSLQPKYFPENATGGKIKLGSGSKWAPGEYTFKLKAVSAIIESDFSNEYALSIN